MNYSKHPTAIVEESNIGAGSSIGAYSILRGGIELGQNCVIGDHVVLKGPLRISGEVVIDSHCVLQGPASLGQGVRVGPQTCIYALSADALSIGDYAVIEPGSVVARNVPANAVVGGNPAKILRYRETLPAAPMAHGPEPTGAVTRTMVRDVTLHKLPLVEDLRGNLSFGEMERHVPFPIKRYFVTFDVASEEARGEHAHRALHQFLVCVHGRVHIVADDGAHREEFILDRPYVGLHLPPLIWGVQYRFSPGAVLLVLCSEFYQPADYIRDYSEFLALVGP
jgi:UDP-2-acetamido-3-amino-2,3-dideoxy-glucuronate N-acetyltransferase